MTWSAAEVSALAARAARGGGAPPHQAERFGQAAAVHLMAGRSPDMLQAALDALPRGPIMAYALQIETALEACADGRPGVCDQAARDALLDSYVEALPCAARLESEGGSLFLFADFTTPRGPRPPRRIAGCGALVSRMQELAALTYVPESEMSRSTGAGAVSSDND